MPAISYDGKAFIVDGRRVWIASGAIHYFRVPRELWRDRLLKLKRAGLNTVETYVAWNAHEPREGHFDFSGNLDFDAFLTLAESLDLWIIVRPGPYICSEWDNGGIPAWLNVKPGIKLRVANEPYHAAIRAFWKRLIPIVARHQVTRGGRVILVQDENEYIYRNRPGGKEHLVYLRNLLRESGIDVPIVVCNFLRERIPDTIECWNCWDDPDKALDTLRKVQPGAPKLITEFWCGWFEAWGHSPEYARSPRQVHANTLRVLANGGMYSYYMFHGGTNFGYYPGRTVGDDHMFMVSSYDYDAPLSETGAMPEKYYHAKLASVLASNLDAFFADSEPADLEVTSPDDVEIVTRSGREGHVIFVFNRGKKKNARLSLPAGVSLDVSFADLDAVALPYRFMPAAGFTIDYSNLSMLGTMPMGIGRLVFLYGPEGKEAVLSAQGRVFQRTVGQDTQVWFGNFPNLIAVMNTVRAKKTWFLSDRTVVGGDFVGDTDGEKALVACRDPHEVAISYFPNGRVKYAACSAAPEVPPLPRLKNWKRHAVEVSGKPAGAKRVDNGASKFVPLEKTGYFGGYGWYYATVGAPRAGRETLLFADAEDRLTTFSNGRRAGTFGRGPGASMGLVSLPLKKGPNDIHILLDNLGRANFAESLGETKGIRAPLYLGARRLRASFAWTSARYNGKVAHTWQIESFWPESKGIVTTLSVVFERKQNEGVVLRLENVDRPAAIFVNREFHSYFWGSRQLSKLDLTLQPAHLADGRNLIELGFFVAPEKTASRRVSLYAFDKSRAVSGPWWFAPFEAPKAKGRAAKAVPGMPAVYETTFQLKDPAAPVFFVPVGLKKGEVWLNGMMVSRYWDIGPQTRVYLPEPWLVGKNTLVVFDESGASPSRSRLEYDPLGIMRKEML